MGTSFWKKYKIEQLPIPTATAEEEGQLEALVERVMERKRAGKDTLSLEAKIDVLVFRPYGLTEAEVLLVLNSFASVSLVERSQVQANYRDLARGTFSAY